MFLPELREAQLVFVDDLAAPVLSDSDFKHLKNSLRISEGETINIADGKGSWAEARFSQEPEVTSDVQSQDPLPQTCVGFAPVKGERSEFVVQKLTELGVAKIVPLECERSIVRWNPSKATKNQTKFLNVARQACMQSRRLFLPEILPVTEVLKVTNLDLPGRICLADPEGRTIESADRTILIGPEGGFAPNEIPIADSVSLPGGVLRAETAAVAAGVMLANSVSGS